MNLQLLAFWSRLAAVATAMAAAICFGLDGQPFLALIWALIAGAWTALTLMTPGGRP